jgi:hypothetical protein
MYNYLCRTCADFDFVLILHLAVFSNCKVAIFFFFCHFIVLCDDMAHPKHAWPVLNCTAFLGEGSCLCCGGP